MWQRGPSRPSSRLRARSVRSHAGVVRRGRRRIPMTPARRRTTGPPWYAGAVVTVQPDRLPGQAAGKRLRSSQMPRAVLAAQAPAPPGPPSLPGQSASRRGPGTERPRDSGAAPARPGSGGKLGQDRAALGCGGRGHPSGSEARAQVLFSAAESLPPTDDCPAQNWNPGLTTPATASPRPASMRMAILQPGERGHLNGRSGGCGPAPRSAAAAAGPDSAKSSPPASESSV